MLAAIIMATGLGEWFNSIRRISVCVPETIPIWNGSCLWPRTPKFMPFITGGAPWPDEAIQLFLRRNQEVVPDGAIPFPRLLATSRDTFLKWSIRPHQCLN